ncbi:hypothetical protein [Zavarzinia sp. CC-PAN008]|uniref:hypothetical protein n=1 Tax=Zavarzinia sp. CC-PAN008 TaxID=3243332 RepID=UPI003F745A12
MRWHRHSAFLAVLLASTSAMASGATLTVIQNNLAGKSLAQASSDELARAAETAVRVGGLDATEVLNVLCQREDVPYDTCEKAAIAITAVDLPAPAAGAAGLAVAGGGAAATASAATASATPAAATPAAAAPAAVTQAVAAAPESATRAAIQGNLRGPISSASANELAAAALRTVGQGHESGAVIAEVCNDPAVLTDSCERVTAALANAAGGAAPAAGTVAVTPRQAGAGLAAASAPASASATSTSATTAAAASAAPSGTLTQAMAPTSGNPGVLAAIEGNLGRPLAGATGAELSAAALATVAQGYDRSTVLAEVCTSNAVLSEDCGQVASALGGDIASPAAGPATAQATNPGNASATPSGDGLGAEGAQMAAADPAAPAEGAAGGPPAAMPSDPAVRAAIISNLGKDPVAATPEEIMQAALTTQAQGVDTGLILNEICNTTADFFEACALVLDAAPAAGGTPGGPGNPGNDGSTPDGGREPPGSSA